ncbi:MAG: cytochrome c [Planctomycetales bacterium]|nr:cytochrome c [Planctomycetales bacterium]
MRADDALDSGLRPSPERGLWLLLNKPYLPPDFDQQAFDNLWRVWEEPLHSQAEKATAEERRALAFARYGLTPRPDEPTKPMQYVVDGRGQWTMNCLACHQGKLTGHAYPGLPNSHFALETLTSDMRRTKLWSGKPLTRMDMGSLVMPLGTSNGTTNAVMFGVALMNYRDADLNIVRNRPPPKMTHHDCDAPPWWNVHRKKRLYADDFAPRGHRVLMQFFLVEENGPDKFREWEDDYRHIEAYINSLRAPKYPFAIDGQLAEAGRLAFNAHCAECHGTYGPDREYPERIVPIDEVGTDRVRLDALSVEHRTGYARSWFNHYGERAIVADPGGYVAPPLDGVWASAPYFHNGSVPTLWHLLHANERPAVWRRVADKFDEARVGLEIEIAETPVSGSFAQKRQYFDTTRFGKSAAGHLFPNRLDAGEKRAILEYLKTL